MFLFRAVQEVTLSIHVVVEEHRCSYIIEYCFLDEMDRRDVCGGCKIVVVVEELVELVDAEKMVNFADA